MNKFLKYYPQFYKPKVGDSVKITQVYQISCHLPYLEVGETCVIDSIENNIYVGRFKLKPPHSHTWQGVCSIGLYNIHFVFNTDE